MIALLLLLVGQVSAVQASSEVRCARADGAAGDVHGESVLRHDAPVKPASAAPVAADHRHEVPQEPLPTAAAASACGAVAFLSADRGEEIPPLVEAAPVSSDAALPRLLADSFFRPPRSS